MVSGLSLRILVGSLLTLCLLVTPLDVAGQGDGPPRTADREAPQREVVVRPLAGDAALTQVVLAPEADTYIASERPFQNFGGGGLFLGYNLTGDGFGAERIFLRFDVDAYVPEGVVIKSARLRLYLAYADPPDDDPMPSAVRRVDAPWSETNLTWNREPVWAREDYATLFIGNSADTAWDWDITRLVEQWVDGTQTNYGLVIIGDERVQQRERAFYSRETDTAFYPRLIIDYADTNDVEPPDITVDDLPTYVDRDFTVSWSGSDPGPADIAYYDVEFRVDGGTWQAWLSEVTATQAEFVGEDGRTYGFRARGVDDAGNVEDFGDVEASTTVDTIPPDATVNPLPSVIGTTTFPVSWSGSDSESGVATYDLLYRVNGSGWTTLLVDTTATSTIFDVNADDFPETDAYYEFEVRAVDEAGNLESFAFEAEAATLVDASAPFVTPKLWLPALLTAVEAP
ncbi:MAG: DNRLRE domain-containing protein [Anaerolineae bacterium]